MSSWIDRINTESNIASFIDEAFLLKHLLIDDVSDLNWMKIFNSSIELSKCFIVEYIRFINWNWLIRPLPEPIVDRFNRNIVQWDVQFYATSRTIEFITRYHKKINWDHLSLVPPQWFNEYHAEIFESLLDWNVLTPMTASYSMNTLVRHVDELNWNWISSNNIKDEEFAFRFMNRINWDHIELDVSNLSTEFLYNIREAREAVYNIEHGIPKSIKKTKFTMMISSNGAKGFDPESSLHIGSCISLKFFLMHWYELDLKKLQDRDMMTPEMYEILEKENGYENENENENKNDSDNESTSSSLQSETG